MKFMNRGIIEDFPIGVAFRAEKCGIIVDAAYRYWLVMKPFVGEQTEHGFRDLQGHMVRLDKYCIRLSKRAAEKWSKNLQSSKMCHGDN